MKFAEILIDLALDSLLQLLAITEDQFSQAGNENKDPQMALEYQKAIELIQQIIVEKLAENSPLKQ